MKDLFLPLAKGKALNFLLVLMHVRLIWDSEAFEFDKLAFHNERKG